METEWISILEKIKKGSFEASIVTSFNAYLPFYEEVLLRHLLSAGCRHNVLLMDSAQFSDCLQEPALRPQLAGREYTLIPISANRAFHPKILLMVSRKKGLLFVGSHNVTFSGFGVNKEITSFLEISNGSKKSGLQVGYDSWDFVRKWVDKQSVNLPKQIHDAFYAVKSFAPWLNKRFDAGEESINFYGSEPEGVSLWERVLEEIKGPISKVQIVGPFFDDQLEFLGRIVTDLAPKDMLVGIEPDRVSIPEFDSEIKEIKFVDVSQIAKSSGYLHAKAIYIEAKSGETWLITGSANPSRPAWTVPASKRNAEAVIVHSGPDASEIANSLGLSQLDSYPIITKPMWSEINKRVRLERKKRDHPKKKQNSLIAIATSEGIRIPKTAFIPKEFVEALLLDNNQSIVEKCYNCKHIDGAVFISAKCDLIGVRIAEVHLIGNKRLICLIHHEQEIKRKSISSRQAQFRRTLSSFQSDNPDLEGLILTVEKIIFDESFDIDPSAKRKAQKKSETETVEQRGELETLAIDIDDTKKGKQRRRMVTSGDIGHLIDVLIHHLGLDLDREIEGVDEKGRTEEELAGTDDEETEKELEPIDIPKIVKICNGKVKRLVNRMNRHFEKTVKEGSGYDICLMKLLAVLAVLRELRKLDYKIKGIPFKESLFPLTERSRLLECALKYLYGYNYNFIENVKNELMDSPWDELSRLHGLLLWLSHDCGADIRAKRGFNESLFDRKKRFFYKFYMLLISPTAVTDPVSITEAELSIRKTNPKFKLAENLKWIEDHRILGEKLFRLKEGALEYHKKISNRPRIGDLAFVRDTENPTLHIVMDSGSRVALTDLCTENGKRHYPPDKIAAISFPRV